MNPNVVCARRVNGRSLEGKGDRERREQNDGNRAKGISLERKGDRGRERQTDRGDERPRSANSLQQQKSQDNYEDKRNLFKRETEEKIRSLQNQLVQELNVYRQRKQVLNEQLKEQWKRYHRDQKMADKQAGDPKRDRGTKPQIATMSENNKDVPRNIKDVPGQNRETSREVARKQQQKASLQNSLTPRSEMHQGLIRERRIHLPQQLPQEREEHYRKPKQQQNIRQSNKPGGKFNLQAPQHLESKFQHKRQFNQQQQQQNKQQHQQEFENKQKNYQRVPRKNHPVEMNADQRPHWRRRIQQQQEYDDSEIQSFNFNHYQQDDDYDDVDNVVVNDVDEEKGHDLPNQEEHGPHPQQRPEKLAKHLPHNEQEPRLPQQHQADRRHLSPDERVYWQKRMPPGFQMLMERITKAVIRRRPNDVPVFIAKFVEESLVTRNAELWALPVESYFCKLYHKKHQELPVWNPKRRGWRRGQSHVTTAPYPPCSPMLVPDVIANESVPTQRDHNRQEQFTTMKAQVESSLNSYDNGEDNDADEDDLGYETPSTDTTVKANFMTKTAVVSHSDVKATHDTAQTTVISSPPTKLSPNTTPNENVYFTENKAKDLFDNTDTSITENTSEPISYAKESTIVYNDNGILNANRTTDIKGSEINVPSYSTIDEENNVHCLESSKSPDKVENSLNKTPKSCNILQAEDHVDCILGKKEDGCHVQRQMSNEMSGKTTNIEVEVCEDTSVSGANVVSSDVDGDRFTEKLKKWNVIDRENCAENETPEVDEFTGEKRGKSGCPIESPQVRCKESYNDDHDDEEDDDEDDDEEVVKEDDEDGTDSSNDCDNDCGEVDHDDGYNDCDDSGDEDGGESDGDDDSGDNEEKDSGKQEDERESELNKKQLCGEIKESGEYREKEENVRCGERYKKEGENKELKEEEDDDDDDDDDVDDECNEVDDNECDNEEDDISDKNNDIEDELDDDYDEDDDDEEEDDNDDEDCIESDGGEANDAVANSSNPLKEATDEFAQKTHQPTMTHIAGTTKSPDDQIKVDQGPRANIQSHENTTEASYTVNGNVGLDERIISSENNAGPFGADAAEDKPETEGESQEAVENKGESKDLKQDLVFFRSMVKALEKLEHVMEDVVSSKIDAPKTGFDADKVAILEVVPDRKRTEDVENSKESRKSQVANEGKRDFGKLKERKEEDEQQMNGKDIDRSKDESKEGEEQKVEVKEDEGQEIEVEEGEEREVEVEEGEEQEEVEESEEQEEEIEESEEQEVQIEEGEEQEEEVEESEEQEEEVEESEEQEEEVEESEEQEEEVEESEEQEVQIEEGEEQQEEVEIEEGEEEEEEVEGLDREEQSDKGGLEREELHKDGEVEETSEEEQNDEEELSEELDKKSKEKKEQERMEHEGTHENEEGLEEEEDVSEYEDDDSAERGKPEINENYDDIDELEQRHKQDLERQVSPGLWDFIKATSSAVKGKNEEDHGGYKSKFKQIKSLLEDDKCDKIQINKGKKVVKDKTVTQTLQNVSDKDNENDIEAYDIDFDDDDSDDSGGRNIQGNNISNPFHLLVSAAKLNDRRNEKMPIKTEMVCNRQIAIYAIDTKTEDSGICSFNMNGNNVDINTNCNNNDSISINTGYNKSRSDFIQNRITSAHDTGEVELTSIKHIVSDKLENIHAVYKPWKRREEIITENYEIATKKNKPLFKVYNVNSTGMSVNLNNNAIFNGKQDYTKHTRLNEQNADTSNNNKSGCFDNTKPCGQRNASCKLRQYNICNAAKSGMPEPDGRDNPQRDRPASWVITSKPISQERLGTKIAEHQDCKRRIQSEEPRTITGSSKEEKGNVVNSKRLLSNLQNTSFNKRERFIGRSDIVDEIIGKIKQTFSRKPASEDNSGRSGQNERKSDNQIQSPVDDAERYKSEQHDFPLRVFVIPTDESEPEPTVTRCLSVSMPLRTSSASLVVQSSYTRPNPKPFRPKIQVSSRKQKCYLGEKSLNWTGDIENQRKLILESEYFAGRNKNGTLEVENGSMWVTSSSHKSPSFQLEEHNSLDGEDKIHRDEDPRIILRHASSASYGKPFTETNCSNVISANNNNSLCVLDREHLMYTRQTKDPQLKLIVVTEDPDIASQSYSHRNDSEGVKVLYKCVRVGPYGHSEGKKNEQEMNIYWDDRNNNNIYDNRSLNLSNKRSQSDNIFTHKDKMKSASRTYKTINLCKMGTSFKGPSMTNHCLTRQNDAGKVVNRDNFLTNASKSHDASFESKLITPDVVFRDYDINGSNNIFIAGNSDTGDDTTLDDIDQIRSEDASLSNMKKNQMHKDNVEDASSVLDVIIENYSHSSSDQSNKQKYRRGFRNEHRKSGNGIIRFRNSIPLDGNGNKALREICLPCEPPVLIDSSAPGDMNMDKATQVISVDIKPTLKTQTGDSLLEVEEDRSGPNVKRLRPNKCLARGYKNSVFSECDPLLVNDDGLERILVDFENQVYASDVGNDGEAQTGTSLNYDGPVCKLDYRYKKIKHPKADIYADCECSVSRSVMSGSSLVNKNMETQVTAANICIGEVLQTGSSLDYQNDLTNDEKERGLIQPSIYKKVISNDGGSTMEKITKQSNICDSCRSRLIRIGSSLEGIVIIPNNTNQGTELKDHCCVCGVPLKTLTRMSKTERSASNLKIGRKLSSCFDDCERPISELNAESSKVRVEFGTQAVAGDICLDNPAQTGSSLLLLPVLGKQPKGNSIYKRKDLNDNDQEKNPGPSNRDKGIEHFPGYESEDKDENYNRDKIIDSGNDGRFGEINLNDYHKSYNDNEKGNYLDESDDDKVDKQDNYAKTGVQINDEKIDGLNDEVVYSTEGTFDEFPTFPFNAVNAHDGNKVAGDHSGPNQQMNNEHEHYIPPENVEKVQSEQIYNHENGEDQSNSPLKNQDEEKKENIFNSSIKSTDGFYGSEYNSEDDEHSADETFRIIDNAFSDYNVFRAFVGPNDGRKTIKTARSNVTFKDDIDQSVGSNINHRFVTHNIDQNSESSEGNTFIIGDTRMRQSTSPGESRLKKYPSFENRISKNSGPTKIPFGSRGNFEMTKIERMSKNGHGSKKSLFRKDPKHKNCIFDKRENETGRKPVSQGNDLSHPSKIGFNGNYSSAKNRTILKKGAERGAKSKQGMDRGKSSEVYKRRETTALNFSCDRNIHKSGLVKRTTNQPLVKKRTEGSKNDPRGTRLTQSKLTPSHSKPTKPILRLTTTVQKPKVKINKKEQTSVQNVAISRRVK